jgi:hypothetical protein
MPSTDIGVRPSVAFERAYSIKAAIAEDWPTFRATNPIGIAYTHLPIRLGIPEAAKVEAELIILVTATLMVAGIILPVTFRMPHPRLIWLILNLVTLLIFALLARLICLLASLILLLILPLPRGGFLTIGSLVWRRFLELSPSAALVGIVDAVTTLLIAIFVRLGVGVLG